jgi:hypothetical protein
MRREKVCRKDNDSVEHYRCKSGWSKNTAAVKDALEECCNGNQKEIREHDAGEYCCFVKFQKIVFKLSEDYAALNSGSKATDMIFRILYSAIPENGKLYKYVMYNNKEQRVYRLLRDDTGDEKN